VPKAARSQSVSFPLHAHPHMRHVDAARSALTRLAPAKSPMYTYNPAHMTWHITTAAEHSTLSAKPFHAVGRQLSGAPRAVAGLHGSGGFFTDLRSQRRCRACQTFSSAALWRTASCASHALSRGRQLAYAARPASISVCVMRASTGAKSCAALRSALQHSPASACAAHAAHAPKHMACTSTNPAAQAASA